MTKFIVIAEYPNSPYSFGEVVITDKEGYAAISKISTSDGDIGIDGRPVDYPHIFKANITSSIPLNEIRKTLAHNLELLRKDADILPETANHSEYFDNFMDFIDLLKVAITAIDDCIDAQKIMS